jgi:hypothetical protein
MSRFQRLQLKKEMLKKAKKNLNSIVKGGRVSMISGGSCLVGAKSIQGAHMKKIMRLKSQVPPLRQTNV